MKKFNKILIIYDSRPETQNTKRIARVMAKVLKADITSLDEVLKYEIQKYDLVGFGSGIFFYKFSKTLRQYIDKLMPYEQKCFVFYTSGMKECIKASVQLVNLLESKKRKNIGIWHCQGRDVAFTLFKKNGGLNKNRPNKKDLLSAKHFAKDLITKS